MCHSRTFRAPRAAKRNASDTFGVPNSRLIFRSPTPLRFGYRGKAGIHAYGSFGTFGTLNFGATLHARCIVQSFIIQSLQTETIGAIGRIEF
jgi:hypothetical protein